MELQQLIQNLTFKGIKQYKNLNIENLSNNSKQKNTHGLYFCLKGSKVDGHNLAEEAINNGAECLVVERYLDLPVTQILVDNARLAMANLSASFYEFDKSKIKFIGVTGTNGKTTTSFMVRDILKSLGCRVGMIGTEGIYNGEIKMPNPMTTPDPIELHKYIHDMDLNNIEYVVMEVSAHALALNKVDSIMYDAVGLTNITQDHLDYFATMENYARAKSLLFNSSHSKSAVINIDDKYTRAICGKAEVPVNTVSLNREADLTIESEVYDVDGTKAIIKYLDNPYVINTNLVGEYNLANTLMALGLINNLGFNFNDIVQAVNNTTFHVPGRLNMIKTKKSSVVIDYAHTPDGIAKVLSTLRGLKKGKLIVVFGCGGNRDSDKRPKMGKIASELADFVIITSDNPRFENPEQIIRDVEKGVTNHNYLTKLNRERAINDALYMAGEDDIVAILGKGAENYQEINGTKYPYNDLEVVNKHFNISQDLTK